MSAAAMSRARAAAKPFALSPRATPTLVYWLVATLVFGAIAAHAANGHFLDQRPRDLWQHLAALGALIADPLNPANPFVPTADPSRHFHPYWLAIAVLARALGWTAWQALGFASFFSAAVLATGIFAFGRSFYRDPWGPLALMAAMLLGWIVPISHTGYHSPSTLIEGIAYPAALLIGLSLNLWALVIRALAAPRLIALVVPLCALMFAIHQLGAAIGFVAAGCLVLFWPDAPPRRRGALAGAMLAGVLLACLWPYMNPLRAILQPGNSSWSGGVDFFSTLYLVGAFVPQIIGLAGLRITAFRRRSVPVVAALGVYLAIFFMIGHRAEISTRFIMPAVLMLHIGMGALFLTLARRWPALTTRQQLGSVALGLTTLWTFALCSRIFYSIELDNSRQSGSLYSPALAITRDLPDFAPVAAYDVGAWPIIATGQRALSQPWPEPGIPDLAQRQAATERLFDPRLSRAERVALAKRWGVRVLIMHRDDPLRRPPPPGQVETLAAQSVRQQQSGPFLRFDLY